MPVRFVIGRAGSGKTARCFNSIVEGLRADPLGSPIYWILPKQATFQAERELTCATDLGGFCRARVLSFDLLGRDVLADCGACATAEVTDLGRQMVIGHLLRKHQPQLAFFGSAAHRAGLAAELDDAFGEIERSGKTVADLLGVIDDLHTTGPADIEARSLLTKLRDLHLLYEAYTTFLGQERVDLHRRATQVLASIERCSLFQGATVYVDGFYQFTDFERRILAVLGKIAKRVEITVLVDPDSPIVKNPHLQPDELSLFHTTEETYRRLWFTFSENDVLVDDPVVLRKVTRFAENPTLAGLEKGLFAPSAKVTKRSVGVELIEAFDRRAEVDAAARMIRRLTTRGGLRLRDIGVFLRDLEDYHELIDASFREHEIPYFVDRRRTAAHHPLLQLTRNAFLVAQQNWAHVPMMTILKTGLAGLQLDEADELENYVLLHRIRGGDIWAKQQPWEFRRELTLGSDEEDPAPAERIELRRINALRDTIVDGLRPFVRKIQAAEKLTVREIVGELFALFERFKVRRTITYWINKAEAEGKFEQRGEHEQVWTELVDLFDQMIDLLGDEQVTLEDFLEILDSGLDRFDLALTPPTVDQVIVGQIDRTRSPQLRAAILLGVNEGVFPRLARPDSILSDAERRTLRERSIEIEPDTERRLLNETLFGYIAFTRASDRLFITRSMSDDAGRPMGPSPFWRRVVQLCPDAPIDAIPRDQQLAPPRIGTPRQLVTSLMHWVRNLDGNDVPSSDDWPALYDWLATHECCDDMIDVMRFRAWKALSYANVATLGQDVAADLFRSPLNASVSRIETFATCPFKHFVRYGLQLREREAEEVTALDLGNIYHQILERLVKQMLQSRQDWTELSPAACEETIRTCARDVGKALRGELMLSSARNKYLLSRIERTLGQVVAGQRAAAQRNKLKPAFAELAFGRSDGRSQLPAFSVKTPRGNELLLHGKIDRVDLVENSAEFAIYDYKLTGNTLSLERVYYGISLQLLTYLLVLQASGQELVGRPITPVAAFYLRLLRKLENVKHPDDALPPDDPAFDLQVKPRGIFDAEHVTCLDSNLTSGSASDVIACRINKDGSFGNRNSSDVAETSEFRALLEHVRKRIGELGDQIIAGQAAVTPYRINRKTPCPTCEFRAVCRFDVAVNHYTILPGMKRDEVLQRVTTAEGSHGA